MVTQTPVSDDPLDSAMNPVMDRRYFGNCYVQTWFCTFVDNPQSGKKDKVLWDASIHSKENRRTAIDIAIDPLPSSGGETRNATSRKLIAESPEWTKFILPSLKALNTDLRQINGQWVQFKLVPTGRTYTSTRPGHEGEVIENTTIQFTAIYDSLDACRAAADALYSGQPNTEPVVSTSPQTTVPNPERDTAAKFLPALWNQAGKDLSKFAELIAKNPLTSKYFSINSPEVLTVIAPF